MIYFLTGKPGGGKSYYSLTLIIEEIVKGHRVVVTNLALKLPQLQVLLLDRYDADIKKRIAEGKTDEDRAAIRDRIMNTDFNVRARVRMLGKDQVGTFFLHRREGIDITPVTQAEEKQGKFPDFADYIDDADTGVMYVIDETHEYFNARCWQSNSLSIFNYLAKHRHYNDEIIFISQNPEQVDKQLKLQVENWLYLVNTGNDLWGRGFRGRKDHSKVHWYKEEPPKRMGHIAKLTAVKIEDVAIEVTKGDSIRIGDCYRTLGCAREGVGGRVTEDKGKVRGRSPLWIALPVVVVVAAVWAVPYGIEFLTSRALGGLESGVNKGLGLPDGQSSVADGLDSVEQSAPLVIRQVARMVIGDTVTMGLAYYTTTGDRRGPTRYYDLPAACVWEEGTLVVALAGDRRSLPAPALFPRGRGNLPATASGGQR